MIARLLSLTTLGSALGCAVVAGVFFAFSSFVIAALARLPAAQGIAAMQSINVAVINRSFLGVFLGTALGCAALAVWSVIRWHEPGAWLRLAGALAYLVGSIAATRIGNIPRNTALAALDAGHAEAAAQWVRFVAGWTAWNHVRTVASALAAALLAWSLRATRP